MVDLCFGVNRVRDVDSSMNKGIALLSSVLGEHCIFVKVLGLGVSYSNFTYKDLGNIEILNHEFSSISFHFASIRCLFSTALAAFIR